MNFRYKPANVCIYCDRSDVDLTDEHIVPYGLGGNLILPKSSCKSCARVTGAEVEQICLRKTLIESRVKYNLPTRNKKDRPTTFRISIGEPPHQWSKDLPIDELPLRCWALPTYNFPGLLLQISPNECKRPHIHCEVSAADMSSLLRHGYGIHPVGLTLAQTSISHFGRMLGKIAHAFAYAEIGPKKFRPCLQGLILQGHPRQEFWIGEDLNELREPDDTLYDLRLCEYLCRNGARFLAVRVRLLGFLGTPNYLVAVGSYIGRGTPQVWRALPVDITIKDRTPGAAAFR